MIENEYDLILKVNYGLEPNIQFITHSAGETHINLNPDIKVFDKYPKVLVQAHINNSQTLMETLNLVDALNNRLIYPTLFIPYCPYSRADRVVGYGGGDSFGLDLFSSLFYGRILDLITIDMHSLKGLEILGKRYKVKNYIPYDKFVINLIKKYNIKDFCLVSPDAGARDKVDYVAKKLNVPHLMLEKVRDQSQKGKIIAYKHVNEYPGSESAIILDDICDGGGTFIYAASCIPRPTRLFLGISHGIFSKGLDPLLSAGFEGIITTDSFAQHNNISKKLQVIGVNECL